MSRCDDRATDAPAYVGRRLMTLFGVGACLLTAALWVTERWPGAPADNARFQEPDGARTPVGSDLRPLPTQVGVDPDRQALGARLFTEPALFAQADRTCRSCHHPDAGGADRAPIPAGLKHPLLAVNAPTVFNSAFNHRFGWTAGDAGLAQHLADVRRGALRTGPGPLRKGPATAGAQEFPGIDAARGER